MGNSHSAGRDNDELIDILIQEKYIESEKVEAAFRRTDRGDYIPSFQPSQIYADQTLRKDYLHLSAPCIYAKVVEALNFKPGNSFLNVGSGTGYLSTVIGSLIGPHAINHGIELREETVRHAYKCLEEYVTTCVCFDATLLAVPYFVSGNGLDLDPDYRKYDRIYVGAEVPQEHKHLFCSLLAEGGSMVMPYMGQLVCVTATQGRYEYEELLPVSFSPLLTHEMLAEEKGGEEYIPQQVLQIEARVRSLQELCRLVIYSAIGREQLEKVGTLQLTPLLQEYVRYYRDPALPTQPRRVKYDTPPTTHPPHLPDPLGLRDYIRMMHAVEYSSGDEEDVMEVSNDEEEDDASMASESEHGADSDHDAESGLDAESEHGADSDLDADSGAESGPADSGAESGPAESGAESGHAESEHRPHPAESEHSPAESEHRPHPAESEHSPAESEQRPRPAESEQRPRPASSSTQDT